MTTPKRPTPEPFTPILSSSPQSVPSLLLDLAIPEHVVTEKEKRQLAARKGAAKRWRRKLRRRFPEAKEIQQAYPLKLMRHYKGSAVSKAEPAFIKPVVQKSARVEKLLRQFPTLTAPGGEPTYKVGKTRLVSARKLPALRLNIETARSMQAQRLAWQCFSQPDEGEPRDYDREAMMESALSATDILKEAAGEANNLPEWKKPNTGYFAREDEDQRRHGGQYGVDDEEGGSSVGPTMFTIEEVDGVEVFHRVE